MSKSKIKELCFWGVALLWLPMSIVLFSLYRFGWSVLFNAPAEAKYGATMMMLCSLSGLFLAIGCRKLWEQGYPKLVIVNAAVLGPVSMFGILFAGLLGPLVMLLYAAILSLPVWLLVAFFRWRNKPKANA